MINSFTSTASYQAITGHIASSAHPHCGDKEDKSEHLLLSCPKREAESQHHFGRNIRYHVCVWILWKAVGLPCFNEAFVPYICSAYQAHHDKNKINNNNKQQQQTTTAAVLLDRLQNSSQN